jgi:spore coat protein U-like protein
MLSAYEGAPLLGRLLASFGALSKRRFRMKTSSKSLIAGAAFAASLLSLTSGPVLATSSTSTLTVNGSVSQSCTTLSPSSSTLTFNAYDSFNNASTPDDNATGVSFTTKCTKGAANVYFSVDGGANFNGAGVPSGDRAMKSTSTGSYLAYQLYQNSPGGTVWPFNSSTGAAQAGPTLTISSSTATQTLSIFGRIPAGQDPAFASDYTDQVTVAINY